MSGVDSFLYSQIAGQRGSFILFSVEERDRQISPTSAPGSFAAQSVPTARSHIFSTLSRLWGSPFRAKLLQASGRDARPTAASG